MTEDEIQDKENEVLGLIDDLAKKMNPADRVDFLGGLLTTIRGRLDD